MSTIASLGNAMLILATDSVEGVEDVVAETIAEIVDEGAMAPDEGLSVKDIMILVTFICNIFSFMLSSQVMIAFITAMRQAKKNKDIAKKKLYLYSMLFVS